ncbi:MAG: hypothetical protein KDJ75_07835 [Alphaproteobacteria bacterium]|nr:hypothetical protein [Alphaproteobacteria bacterium]
MGSLTSTPSAPAQPQVVYVPAPTPVSTTPSTAQESADTTASGSEGQDAHAEEEQQAARARSLLERSRGRFGTIQTGFRGLLGLAAGQNGQRKTLLGE